MLRYPLLTLAVVFLLTGCSGFNSSSDSYPHAAKSVPPMKTPASIDAARFQTNYPIPTDINPATGQSPSITPPGSNTLYNPQINPGAATNEQPAPQNLTSPNAQPTAQIPAPAQAATAAQIYGDTMILNMDYAQAWQKVGSGIQHAGYKILDKDESMGSYYILNTQATQGKITKATPIVQVHMEKMNNQTKVMLLNEQNQPLNASLAAQIMQDLKTKGQL